jgi:hypothetical protein
VVVVVVVVVVEVVAVVAAVAVVFYTCTLDNRYHHQGNDGGRKHL